MRANQFGCVPTLILILLSLMAVQTTALNFTFFKLFDPATLEKISPQNIYKRIGMKRMQSNAPIINFPANFEMVLSNNDPGFNLTEIIYMVRFNFEVESVYDAL